MERKRSESPSEMTAAHPLFQAEEIMRHQMACLPEHLRKKALEQQGFKKVSQPETRVQETKKDQKD